MKMRVLAASLTAVLIVGGTLTIVQRAITQKTRGVLPAANDPAHADSRRAVPVPHRAPRASLGLPAAGLANGGRFMDCHEVTGRSANCPSKRPTVPPPAAVSP